MKRILLILGLLLLLEIPSRSQERIDSTITITFQEAKTLAKMTEDLRWTRSELKLADSIITHKDSIISLKDQQLKAKKTKTKVISSSVGLLIGILIGLLL